MTAVEHVPPEDWRSAIQAGLAAGQRFAGAWATEDGGWRAILVSGVGAGERVLVCETVERRVDTLIDIVGAADWDEREAHDLYGLQFDGHEPLRALAAHPADLEAWVTPVGGDGVHQVAVGPIHAGVIESGHFRFHTVGEKILAMDPRMFYKHRGLERAAEGAAAEQAIVYAGRACAACQVANTVAYAHAVEDALGHWPDPWLRRQRTVLLELERVYNHLHDIGAICAGVGYALGTMAFAALKDRAQELCARAFGHRFMFGTVIVGRTAADLDADATDRLTGGLRELRADAFAAWRDLEFAGSLRARLDGVGCLDREDALALGAVGPAARASGVAIDARVANPRLACPGIQPAAVPDAAGDVAARLQIRSIELTASFDLLDDLLGEPLTPGGAVQARPPFEIGVGRVESPRGETVCAVELAGPRVARLHLRTASYANWPALAHATAGNLLPDFPLINKSFELCYACVDR
ncbi:MAG: hydrogenase large subunit [Solirubrobacteraceae bacterium]